MKLFLSIFSIMFLISCAENNSTTQETESSNSSETEKPKTDTTVKVPPVEEFAGGCYMKITGRDTAILMIEQSGNDVKGKLLYDNYEKDGSRGFVKGKEDGGIIKLWYDFNSEGVRSVMEAYFKKENGRLLRGIGSMDVKSDTTYFISGVNYSDKEAFNKVDCSSVKSKMEW